MKRVWENKLGDGVRKIIKATYGLTRDQTRHRYYCWRRIWIVNRMAIRIAYSWAENIEKVERSEEQVTVASGCMREQLVKRENSEPSS